MIRVTFVMEQHVGLYSYYQYLRRFMDSEAAIEATWVPVTYFDPHSAIRRLAFLPAGVRSALHGRAQATRGIARTPGEVLFFNTQVPAALAYGVIKRHRYVLSTDVTPVQYDRIGDEYGHRPDRAGFLRHYKHHVNVRLFRGATRLLPWSRWVADSLVTDYGVAPQKIEVVPPGIDLTRWTPGYASEGEDRPVRILFVGADLRRKGGPLLIEAFRAVRSSGVELHLVTAGELPSEPGLFVYNDMKNNGDALIDLYRKCDIFCLPTLADCLPMALLEAGAAGLPAISTNLAAIPEIVREAETGFLIEPGDLGSLIERIQLLARDPALRRRMGRAARLHAEIHFDARRNGRRVLEGLLETAEMPSRSKAD